MPRKLAVKRLRSSDLTLFEHQHRQTAGKQKSITLNKNPFSRQFYAQALGNAVNGHKCSVDLFIYGPGMHGSYNLQRKIILSEKNWRLDGELIYNPPSERGRFDRLAPNDFAVFEFLGEYEPDVCRVVFISQNTEEDASLFVSMNKFLDDKKMLPMTQDQLEEVVERANVVDEHPIKFLLLGEEIEDAAYFGEEGTAKLLRQKSARMLTREDLDRARQSAEESGARGEEFVDTYLKTQLENGAIASYEWTSQINVISPFDFQIVGDPVIELDAKSTTYGFEKKFHVSISELRRMASVDRYDIYRIYDMTTSSAKLRICTGMRVFATSILSTFESLREGVTIDSVSIDPHELEFGPEINIVLPEDEEEGDDEEDGPIVYSTLVDLRKVSEGE